MQETTVIVDDASNVATFTVDDGSGGEVTLQVVQPPDVDVDVAEDRGPEGPVGPAGTINTDELATAVTDYLDLHPGGLTVGEQGFPVADTTWEWVHNFGYTPNVTLLTIDRRRVEGSITFNDGTRTVAEFYFPVAGVMVLS